MFKDRKAGKEEKRRSKKQRKIERVKGQEKYRGQTQRKEEDGMGVAEVFMCVGAGGEVVEECRNEAGC